MGDREWCLNCGQHWPVGWGLAYCMDCATEDDVRNVLYNKACTINELEYKLGEARTTITQMEGEMIANEARHLSEQY